MHLPKRWWIGLPILAGVAFLANDALIPEAEAALKARVAAKLAQAPDAIDNPQVSVTGRDVKIGGVALSPDVKNELFAALGADAGARVINDATQAIGVAKPFVMKIERRGDNVAISGNLPVSGVREKMRAALGDAGLAVSDATAFAQGAPANFSDVAVFAAQQVAALDPAEITVSDATLSISGEARSPADYQKTVAALKAAPAGVALKSQISAPRVSPFVFSATLRDGVIALSGYVPSDEARKTIVARAAATGAGVSDALQLGAGAPGADYDGALAFAVGELGKLSHGKATITDGKLTIEGQGRDNVQPATLESDAKALLPQGFELAKLDVAAGAISPYRLSVERTNGEVAFSGYAPDEATRARLIDAARKRFFDANVVDRLAIARGAPPAFAEAAERALDALARLAEGRLALSGSSATLSGAARYDAARHDIERAFPDMMPQSFRGEAQLSSRAVGSPLDAVRCQAALADLVAKSPIRFGSDDSSLAPESVALVDAIAATALRCQNAIEIGAYTDNRGIDEINVARSKRRAQALADALIRAGVDPFRVTSVGYGAERPVASNDNDENRARNNRVEFVVK